MLEFCVSNTSNKMIFYVYNYLSSQIIERENDIYRCKFSSWLGTCPYIYSGFKLVNVSPTLSLLITEHPTTTQI